MELPVYDVEGKEVSTLKLAPEIFGLKLNNDLMHQVVTSQMANRRKTIAHAKDRSEVGAAGRNLGGKREQAEPDTVPFVRLCGGAAE